MIVVLSVVAVMAMRPSDADRAALSDRRLQPDSPADRPVDVPFPAGTLVRSEPPVPVDAPEPSAVVVAESLASDGVPCASGTARPVLNTVRPVLTARMTASAPANFEIKKENDVGSVSYDAGDMAAECGYVTLYLRGAWRLQPGESYRWRVHGTAANEWSPWCEFTIAATTLDSLNLDEDRLLTAGLPPSRWRAIAAVLGPGWPHGDTPLFWSIQEAGGRVSAGEVPVSLRGWDWETVIEPFSS